MTRTRDVTAGNKITKRQTARYIVRWTETAVGYAGIVLPSERAYLSRAAADAHADHIRAHQPCSVAPIIIPQGA